MLPINAIGTLQRAGRSLRGLTRPALLAAVLLASGCAAIGEAEYFAGQQAFDLGQYQIARVLWHGAAQLKDADAQHGIGWLHDQGLGVPPDPLKAAEWYSKAARQDHAAAQLNLGNLYDDGRGVPQDYAKAAEWFRRAAGKGVAEAQNNLGWMYREGHGVPRDDARAFRLLARAADQGYPPAQNAVGVMYFRGQGVEKNLENAYFWLELATRNGQPGATHNRDFIAAFLTKDVILKLKNRADAR